VDVDVSVPVHRTAAVDLGPCLDWLARPNFGRCDPAQAICLNQDRFGSPGMSRPWTWPTCR